MVGHQVSVHDAKIAYVEMLLDELIKRDPDRAERLIEKHLARAGLRQRLKRKKALAAQKGGAQ